MRPSITISADIARQRELIDAAIAVNEAPTLDEAFQVVADASLALLNADRVSVVVWNEDLSQGTVRAAAGEAVDALGHVMPADPQSLEALETGEPVVGTPLVEGVSPELRAAIRSMSSIVRVPVMTENTRATFNASWRTRLDAGEAADAAEVLQTLMRLTTIAERALREREQENFGFVLNAVADGVVLSSPGGVLLNAAARRILGLGPHDELELAELNLRELDGTPFAVLPGETVGRETMETGRGGRFRVRVTTRDRRELVLDGSIAPSGAGAVIVFRDVTDEHREYTVNRQLLETVFDAIPTAISVATPGRRLIKVNRAFGKLVGRPPHELVGLTAPFPWWDEREAEAPWPGNDTIERVFRLPDGRPQPVEISRVVVPGDDGDPALLIALIHDRSDERRMQQQLVQSGKLAAIGELAAGVAHEINNPLFAILGLTEFLLKESEPGSKARQRLELIQQTGLEIKEIVRALLDFARENAEERHVVALEDVVQQTVDLVRRTNAHKGVELVDSYDDSQALVSASPNQLKQIFLNLIANARQAMPNGGTVKVDVRSEGEWVQASVCDDGPGIDPAVLERIFEPFYTTKRTTGGTGLGLSVSLGIAESHGGSLTATSEPGNGATFTLRLPVASEEVDE